LKLLLTEVLNIAKSAGEAILAVYRGLEEIVVTVKEDDTPLTKADLAADQIITTQLNALSPRYPILSEESVITPFAERKNWSHYWLVDPLDGTREFIHRTDDFTVNIALIVAQKPVLGVVHAPAHGVSYVAAYGVGVFKITATGVWQPILIRPKPDKPTVVVSRFHNSSGTLAQHLQKMGECIINPVGSALKPCLIAEGAADLYIRFGPTSEWDTAASQCILELAGGRMFDLSGQTLCYNTKDSLLNPAFISVGDTSIDWLNYLQL
jgi:3'(2'), 5'-bisphosphate nucleotidase